MYKIEISSFWIESIGKSIMYGAIAILTFILFIKLIRVVKRDWHNEDEISMNITILVLAFVVLSITFNTIYLILNIWGILEITVV